MRIFKTVTVALVATISGGAAASAAQAPTIAVQPLAQRDGVVLNWRAQSRTAVVVLPSGRMMAVHALRRVAPGTRVRVDGIKWGTPTSGIKWGAPRAGIKWGIKWSRNGSFQSNLRPLGIARTTSLRGRVVRRYRGGVVVGVRGGLVGVRMAVWLPRRGKSNHGRLPVVGEDVLIDVRFGPRGRLIGTGAEIVRSGPGPISVVGDLASVSAEKRVVRISSFPDPAFRVEATLGVPTSVDMSRLTAGGEVAATATVSPDGSLRLQSLAPNQSFAAGNDPAAQVIVPPSADEETLDLLLRARTRWDAGRTAGAITDEATYLLGRDRLARADVHARDGNVAAAQLELDAFITEVTAAVPGKVSPTVAADVLALADAAFTRLAG